MKNYFKFTLLSMLSIFLFPISANACVGNYNLAARPSVTSLTNGGYVNFTVSFSSATRFANWDASFTYDQNKLQFISGDTNLASAFIMSPITSKTYVYRFKTKAIGQANFNFKVNSILAFDAEETLCPGSKAVSASVNIVAPRDLSSNNYLKDLVIEGITLSPKFNRNTYKYAINLPEKTAFININAVKEDLRSGISGAGKISLNEGDNTINIIVTAENGASRTYSIVANVAEPNPIRVTVEKLEYTVVRKSEQIVKPNEDFVNTEIKIGEEEVPALVNEKLDMTIVALRNSDNQVSLFIYKDGKYSPFKMIKTKLTELLINEKKAVKDYRKASIKIDEVNYSVYKKGDYFYFYATNLKTAKEKLYRFEQSEESAQIEAEEQAINVKPSKNDNRVVTVLAIALGLTYLILLINVLRNKKTNSAKNYENEDKSDNIEVEFKKRSKRRKN